MTAKRIPNTIKLADGRRVVCRIFDNGGETLDRYTVALKAKRSWRGHLYYPYLAASEHPFHPQGFGQYGESQLFLKGSEIGTRIAFEQCPPDAQQFVLAHFLRW